MSDGIGRYPHECLLELARCLISRDMLGEVSWILNHVGYDEAAWDEYAIALAALAQSGIEETLPVRDGLVWIPRSDGDQAAADAALLVTMMLNHDAYGARGLLAGIRERGDTSLVCGSLAVIASLALRGARVEVVEVAP